MCSLTRCHPLNGLNHGCPGFSHILSGGQAPCVTDRFAQIQCAVTSPCEPVWGRIATAPLSGNVVILFIFV